MNAGSDGENMMISKWVVVVIYAISCGLNRSFQPLAIMMYYFIRRILGSRPLLLQPVFDLTTVWHHLNLLRVFKLRFSVFSVLRIWAFLFSVFFFGSHSRRRPWGRLNDRLDDSIREASVVVTVSIGLILVGNAEVGLDIANASAAAATNTE